MVRILPFRGVRYQAVEELSAVTAPPYDVIDAGAQQALYDQHPANVVRLILNQPTPTDSPQDNPYTRAAGFLNQWLAEGVLFQEETPAVYAYTQTWEGIERKGLWALLQLEALSGEGVGGNVLPHEHTLGGPKVDRLHLMRATQANLSPIFMIYADPERSVEQAFFQDSEGWATATDADAVVHRLKALTEPEALQRIEALFADQKLLIADGHHRYETALNFQQEVREAYRAAHGQDAPAGALLSDYIMVFLTNLEDPGLKVYPTHRVLYRWPEGWDAERFEAALYRHFAPAVGSNDAAFTYQRGATATPLALQSLDSVRALPEIMQGLDVAILDEVVFKGLFQTTADALKGEHVLGFYRDEAAVHALLESGEAVAAFWMGTPPVSQIRAVSEAGFRMPQKSTYFYPKLLSGLVFYRYCAEGQAPSALQGVVADAIPLSPAWYPRQPVPSH